MPKTPAKRNQKRQQRHGKADNLKKSRQIAKESVVSSAPVSEPVCPQQVEKRELEIKLYGKLQQIYNMTNEQVLTLRVELAQIRKSKLWKTVLLACPAIMFLLNELAIAAGRRRLVHQPRMQCKKSVGRSDRADVR